MASLKVNFPKLKSYQLLNFSWSPDFIDMQYMVWLETKANDGYIRLLNCVSASNKVTVSKYSIFHVTAIFQMINLQTWLHKKFDYLTISHHMISAKSCYIADTMHKCLAVKAISYHKGIILCWTKHEFQVYPAPSIYVQWITKFGFMVYLHLQVSHWRVYTKHIACLRCH